MAEKKNNLAYWKKLFRMSNFIQRKATGSPERFAKKVELSRTALYRRIDDLKSLNAPISYDKFRETYYFTEPFSLKDEITKYC